MVAARLTAFVLVLLAAALMPAPVRAGEALKRPRTEQLQELSQPRLGTGVLNGRGRAFAPAADQVGDLGGMAWRDLH